MFWYADNMITVFALCMEESLFWTFQQFQ